MNPLRPALAEYLAVRRAMGFKLQRAEKLLTQFVSYLDTQGAETITTDLAVAWASLPGGGASWWSYRLSAVRGFATYLHTIDPATEIPAAEILPDQPHRATPYLYSDSEIAALIAAAATLRSPWRTATYQTLIGLLAVTGLRIGEAIRLDTTDVDIEHCLLTVRESKFGKSRMVPIRPSTLDVLGEYLHHQDRPQAALSTPAVFVSTAGTRLLYCNVNWTFLRLVDKAELRPRSASCRPRIHDLRHSFAVRSLLDAYREGCDVHARLHQLSTYLGHVHPGSTYWYLCAAPELLALAAQRLERTDKERS